MSTWVVEMPGFLPTSTNVLMRLHWSKRRRLLRAEGNIIALYVRQAEVPKATGKRRLSLCFVSPSKLGDADNFLKLSLDALTACGQLVDDSPRWLELDTVESVRGPVRKMVITLEDC